MTTIKLEKAQTGTRRPH